MSRQFVKCWLLLAGLALAGARTEAQRPILPICSDDPAMKLPPCKVAPGAEPQQGQSVSTDGGNAPANPATAFPFPGDPAPASSGTPKSAAEEFPFPGSAPAPAQPAAAPNPSAPSSPAAPSDPQAAGDKSGAKDAFPFPGENVPLPVLDPNEKVYDPNEGKAGPPTPRPAAPPAEAPDSSSSSSSSSDAEPLPDLRDEGSEGSTASQRRRMPRVEDMGKREAEDLKVAKFYHSTGNYMAAYMRAKDALKIDPEDPEAHLALAINAQKLAKKEDAIAGYTSYLKLAPDGDSAQAAKKALAALQ